MLQSIQLSASKSMKCWNCNQVLPSPYIRLNRKPFCLQCCHYENMRVNSIQTLQKLKNDANEEEKKRKKKVVTKRFAQDAGSCFKCQGRLGAFKVRLPNSYYHCLSCSSKFLNNRNSQIQESCKKCHAKLGCFCDAEEEPPVQLNLEEMWLEASPSPTPSVPESPLKNNQDVDFSVYSEELD